MRVALLCLLAACGGEAPRPAKTAAAPSSMPAREAEEILASWQPDYEYPLNGHRWDERVGGLFLDACKAGDMKACLRALDFHAPDADKLVAANCRAGDQLSCRALPANSFRDAPGAGGRFAACFDPGGECNQEHLRQECDAGFAYSCQALAQQSQDPGQWDQVLMGRAQKLGLEGCRAGVTNECSLLDNTHSDEVRELLCSRSNVCIPLARAALERGDTKTAQRAFERHCQSANQGLMACIYVGVAYVNHKLDEPVPGRGQQLVDWGCKRLKEITPPKMYAAVKDCSPPAVIDL